MKKKVRIKRVRLTDSPGGRTGKQIRYNSKNGMAKGTEKKRGKGKKMEDRQGKDTMGKMAGGGRIWKREIEAHFLLLQLFVSVVVPCHAMPWKKKIGRKKRYWFGSIRSVSSRFVAFVGEETMKNNAPHAIPV